jgi:hypothetical protein
VGFIEGDFSANSTLNNVVTGVLGLETITTYPRSIND